MTIKEKIQKYIDYKGISVYRLEADAGLSKGYWGKTKSISADIAMKISRIYRDMSTEWLLRDEGEMLKKNTIGINMNQDDGNIIGQGNHNNIKTGNVVNVALPDAGTQKIIKPDGEIEVITTESNTPMLDTLKRENENLKAEVMYLKNTITTKNDLIDSLRETIDILKNR